ncbi:hypothetical protein KR009_008817, partial [Drosophila setifemur]
MDSSSDMIIEVDNPTRDVHQEDQELKENDNNNIQLEILPDVGPRPYKYFQNWNCFGIWMCFLYNICMILLLILVFISKHKA